MALPSGLKRSCDKPIPAEPFKFDINEWPCPIKLFRRLPADEANGILPPEQHWSHVQSYPIHQTLLKRGRIERPASLDEDRSQSLLP